MNIEMQDWDWCPKVAPPGYKHLLTSSQVVWQPEVEVLAHTCLAGAGVDNLKRLAETAPSRSRDREAEPIDWEERYQGTDSECLVEFAGRTCYQSHDKGRSSDTFHNHIRQVMHGSLWEHASITFLVRGVTRWLTHELVRHRTGVAYSQLSTRYADVSNMRMVVPADYQEELRRCPAAWQEVADRLTDHQLGVDHYQLSLQELTNIPLKRRNEIARGWLSAQAETELVVTFNLRSFLHFLRLRGDRHAATEIRLLAFLMYKQSYNLAPRILNCNWRLDELKIPYIDNPQRVSP